MSWETSRDNLIISPHPSDKWIKQFERKSIFWHYIWFLVNTYLDLENHWNVWHTIIICWVKSEVSGGFASQDEEGNSLNIDDM